MPGPLGEHLYRILQVDSMAFPLELVPEILQYLDLQTLNDCRRVSQ